MEQSRPQPLGRRRSFGFGDRLGVATPGHLAASRRFSFAPVFAQQSLRELERTRRTHRDVLAVAQGALSAAGYRGLWGADADRLKTEADIDQAIASGFTWLTLDPTAFVEPRANRMSPGDLEEAVASLIKEGVLPADWDEGFLDGPIAIGPRFSFEFSRTSLSRAAVKFGRAVQRCQALARHIHRRAGRDDVEMEVSWIESDAPMSPLEHLLIGRELKRRGVALCAFAPRMPDGFEIAVDYRGDAMEFERWLAQHAAIARDCGHYKISVHRASEKFSILPAVGRACGDLLHVKTSGTSYLEALRVVCRTGTELFREIVTHAAEHYDEARGP